MALDRLAEQSLEPAVVLVISINALALIAPADNVIKRPSKVHSRSSRHEGRIAQCISISKIPKPDTYPYLRDTYLRTSVVLPAERVPI
jgi:hypothetical protein